MKKQRLAVIGLDCAAPQLVFDRFRDDLPNLRRLMENGGWGRLKSTDPPITVPAWMSMMTSKDPGRLGVYGFRNFKDKSFRNLYFANARAIREKLAWDILGAAGKKCIVLGVPQTYPPAPINGWKVTSFLTPGTDCQYTYPAALKDEVEAVVGEYEFDVRGFRTDDKERLLQQVYRMTGKRFTLARHLVAEKDWDFFMMVEIGLDRVHHGFWKYFDTGHRKHEPGSPYRDAVRDYYRYLDREIGELIAALPDATAVLVVSDHGAKKMAGGICINEWLRQEGYLTLLEEPPEPVPLAKAAVDWSKTRAWGEGGYYSRILFNVAGWADDGVVPQDEVAALRREIKEKLEAMPDDRGRPMGTRVLLPEETYPVVRGIPPMLMVYFGDLDWRSIGSVGMGCIYSQDNDTGPDDANHDHHGIFIGHLPGRPGAGQELTGLHILDIAPTVLDYFAVAIPADWQGNVIKMPGPGGQGDEGSRE